MSNNGWLDAETFSCFVPAQMVLVKGGESGADKSGKRWIQGIASTDGRDLQGEIIAQNGIDFTYFLKHGYFNDDHKAGPEHKVGQPTEAKLTKNGMWVKGFLFKNHKKADEYWELMQALEASGSNRQVGFSIQGKVLRKNGNTIEKCWIQDVAITTQPVNTATWAQIAKSLATEKWDLIKEDDRKMSAGGFTRAEASRIADMLGLDFKREGFSLDAFCEGLNVELEHSDVTQKRAIATAKIARDHLRERPDYYEKLRKLEKEPIKTEKAVTSGGPMSVESLDGRVRNTVTAKSLSYSEACDFVKSQTGITNSEEVKSIVNVAFGLFGKE